MPLTNAEKQKAHRQRQREKIARYEGALRRIATLGEMDGYLAADLAQEALS